MAKLLQNQFKTMTLSLLIFLFSDICFAEQINIPKPFRHETSFKSKLFYNFEKSLFKKLEENKEILTQNYDNEGGKIKYIDVREGEEREISEMQRDALERAFVNAPIKALEKTPIGKKVERLVDKISLYTRVKYKKSGDHSKFYFPGEIEDGDKGKYGVSLSASLYPDSNSLREDFSVGLKAHYGRLESELFFRPDTNETKINFQYKNFAIWAKNETGEKGELGFLFKKEF